MALPLIGAGAAALGVGALSVFGGLMSNDTNAKTAAANRQMSEREAQINRDFQESMSNTAHTREVRDLRNAGLNPVLSGTGGMGASTPSGGMATPSGYTAQDVITPGISTALAARRNVVDVKNVEADTNLKGQQEDHVREQKHLAYQQSRTEEERVKEQAALARIATARAVGEETEADIDRTKFGRGIRYINRALPGVSSAVGAGRLGQGLRHDRWIRDGK